MATINIRMRLVATTPGALIYAAINGNGGEVGLKDVAVGKIYVRKDKIEGQPKKLELSLEY